MSSVIKFLQLALMGALAIGALSCRSQDIRTKTIQVPQMTNDHCAKIVTEALSRAEGIVPEGIKVGPQSVTVTYDSMRTALKNLEFSIAGAGFDADEIAADPKARAALPADCR
jgi:periplasmic mercuric ion binding protein